MADFRGVEAQESIDIGQVLRPNMQWWQLAARWLQKPRHVAVVMGVQAIIVVPMPVLSIPFLFTTVFVAQYFRARRPRMPLRVPSYLGGVDPTELDAKTKQPKPANGIYYLGNNRSRYGRQEECWITNSDSRTHALVMGTTGSGKTETLLSFAFNAIVWGSGFIYVDGKADNSLPAKVYALCKRVGREDDFLVINFMTGDVDAFARSRDESRQTNTINVYAEGSANSMTQLTSSLMAEAGGDNALWKGLAVGMINAVLTGLAYKRWRFGIPIDAGVIRDSIELGRLIELTKEFANDPDVPKDLVFKPLEAYLVNLPGFDWANNLVKGDPVSEDTKKQHDFRSMQFLRQLTMVADTYGHVFRHRLAEVDMLDVVLNRRILVVMIPSLEKSEEESEGVGKLLISALKLMMSLTLGSHVEGMYEDVVESKVTEAPAPYPCILDELGYYFTKGLAVMFAQARSLGFQMIAAGQDLPAMMKGKNKEEAESVIANTKFKISLAMEDPQSTAELFLKTAGKAIVTQSSGYSGDVGALATTYTDMLNASITDRDRLTLQELRDLDEGQGILLWRDRVVRFKTFYVFGRASVLRKIPTRLNRLVKLYAPTPDEIVMVSEPVATAESTRMLLMGKIFAGQEKVSYLGDESPLTKALQQAHLGFPTDRKVSSTDTLVSYYTQVVKLVRGYSQPANAVEKAAGSSGNGIAPREAHDQAADALRNPAAPAVPESIDAATFVEIPTEAFVVAHKTEVESPAAPVEMAEADWVETGAANGEVVMDGSAANLLALMDSVLTGGEHVAAEEAADKHATELVDALTYSPQEQWQPSADVDDKANELYDMFKGFS